jgi:hypothetical protein
MQHLETALAKNLGRGIPKQPFRRSVPRNNLSLIVHGKGGICGPLKEGKQLTLEHSKTSKMHIGVEQLRTVYYDRVLKIHGSYYKYTITHGQHDNKLPRWLLLSGSEDLRLIFHRNPGTPHKDRQFDIPLQPVPWWASEPRRFSYPFRGG